MHKKAAALQLLWWVLAAFAGATCMFAVLQINSCDALAFQPSHLQRRQRHSEGLPMISFSSSIVDNDENDDLSSALSDWEFEEDEDDDSFPIIELDDHEMVVVPSDSSNEDEGFLAFDDATHNTSAAAPLTLDQLSEAFAANVSYFYLKNELGLSDTAMWRITFEASSALGMTTAVVRHKVNVLRETMDLSDDDVRTVLNRQPTILHLSADKNISPTILYLLRALDLGRDDLRALVMACPAILGYSITNLKSKISFFTRLMEYTVEECRELLLQEPNLIRAGVNTGLIPRLQFLQEDIELPIDKLKRIVQKHPRILLYSLDQNLVPKLVYYMIMKLQMSTAQVHKLLLAYPLLLDRNLDRAILPTTLYFVKDLDFSPAEFRNMLLKFPRILTHSLRKIKYTVGYFRFELGMSASQVKNVLYRAPSILGLNTDTNIKGKVAFLQRALGLNDTQLHTVIAAMPSLLLLNSECNLQPKLDYLNAALQSQSTTTTTAATLGDTVVRSPTLLGYSFEKRIRPRVEAILEAGLDPSCITIGIPKKQDDFDSWLRLRADKFHKRQLSVESAVLSPSTTSALALPTFSKRIVHWSRERRPRPDV